VSGDAGGEGRAKELPFRRFSGKEPPFWGSLDMFGAGFQNHKPTPCDPLRVLGTGA